MPDDDRIRWAPKVSRGRIWQLYQSDARGVVDEELIDDVGLALLERCHSILQVTNRQVVCPRCGTVVTCRDSWAGPEDQAIHCSATGCVWQTTWARYHASWRHRDLIGTAALPAFGAYAERYPTAGSPRGKMVLIDQLRHAFHWDLKLGLPNRSAANNLIEGSHEQVIALLETLTYGDPRRSQSATTSAQWEETVERMRRRRRGG